MDGLMGVSNEDNAEYDYWCHYCRRIVLPVFAGGGDEITCSLCHRAFLERLGQLPSLFGNTYSRRVTFRHRLPTLSFELDTTPFALRHNQRGTGDSLMQRPWLQNTESEDERNRNGTPPASKAAVKEMAIVALSAESLPMECVVCLEDFHEGDVVRQMPCKHFYHSHCILPWLELHSCCPTCRFELPVLDHDNQRPKREEPTTGDRHGNAWFRNVCDFFAWCFGTSGQRRDPSPRRQ